MPVKEIPNSPTGWAHYAAFVKSLLNRDCTKKEYGIIMAAYINRKAVEDCVMDLESKQ